MTDHSSMDQSTDGEGQCDPPTTQLLGLSTRLLLDWNDVSHSLFYKYFNYAANTALIRQRIPESVSNLRLQIIFKDILYNFKEKLVLKLI